MAPSSIAARFAVEPDSQSAGSKRILYRLPLRTSDRTYPYWTSMAGGLASCGAWEARGRRRRDAEHTERYGARGADDEAPHRVQRQSIATTSTGWSTPLSVSDRASETRKAAALPPSSVSALTRISPAAAAAPMRDATWTPCPP